MKYFLLFFLLSNFSYAQSVENLVITCTACHGEKGISNNDLWPNLAGQKKGYLILQLKNYRSGTRPDPIMNPISLGLSDEDIEKLADYYSRLK